MQVVLLTEGSDLDSLSSAYALTLLEKNTYIFLPNTYSESMKLALKTFKSKFKDKIVKKEDLKNIKKAFIVDTSSLKKIYHIIKEAGIKDLKRIVVIDHHKSLENLKGKNIKKISINYGACTTYFVKKIKRKKIDIDKIDATILALGIYEDTGSFKYDNTTEEDLKAVAFLASKGLDFDLISEILSKKFDEKVLKVLEEAVENLQIIFIKNKKIGISTVFCNEYIPDISQHLTHLKELNNLNAFFLTIVQKNKVSVIARSKDIDVSQVLSFFGGGGHKRAAAVTLKDIDYKEFIQELETIITKTVLETKTIKDFVIKDYKSFNEETPILEIKGIKDYFIFTVDDKGNYKGIVFLKAVRNALKHGLKNLKLKDLAIEDLYTFSVNTPVYEAEKVALTSSQDIFPVLDREKITGYVTKRSLIGSIHLDGFQTEEDVFISRRRLVPKQINFKSKIERYLPEEILKVLKEIGEFAHKLNMKVYLVGGIVRDIIMGRENLDIDLIVEGQAVKLAKEYAKGKNLKFTKFEEFMTAQVKIRNLKIDLATARKEIYPYPGAYPKVEKATLREDLYRRDFTINTLAIDITKDNFGMLIDYFNGISDIKNKKIRILHQLSFIEDPIRIFRALRFAGRFDFSLGKSTEKLLRVAVDQNLVNAAPVGRINLELNLTFEESKVVEIIKLMSNYKVLPQIIPFFNLDEERIKLLERLRENILLFKESFDYKLNKPSLYLLALMYHLPLEESYVVLEKYFFQNAFKIFEEFFNVKDKINKKEKNSEIFDVISQLKKETIVFLASYYSQDISEKIINILKKANKNIITGKDLINLGLKPSKDFSKIIKDVKKLYLDNKIKTKKEALKYVKEKFL